MQQRQQLRWWRPAAAADLDAAAILVSEEAAAALAEGETASAEEGVGEVAGDVREESDCSRTSEDSQRGPSGMAIQEIRAAA